MRLSLNKFLQTLDWCHIDFLSLNPAGLCYILHNFHFCWVQSFQVAVDLLTFARFTGFFFFKIYWQRKNVQHVQGQVTDCSLNQFEYNDTSDRSEYK